MLGLIIKDFYTLRLYVKQIVIMFIFFIAISYFTGSITFFISFFMSIISILMIIYTFSYDMVCKWDRYAQTMPVTKNEIVMGKYIVTLLLTFFGVLLSTVVTFILQQFGEKAILSIQLACFLTLFLFSILLFFASIFLPLIFKFGVERARLILFPIFLIPSISFLLFSKLNIASPSEHTIFLLVKLSPVAGIAIFVLSYFISCHGYRNKEQ